MNFILVTNNYTLKNGDSLVYSTGRSSVLLVQNESDYSNYVSKEDIDIVLSDLKYLRKITIKNCYQEEITEDFIDTVTSKVFNGGAESFNNLYLKYSLSTLIGNINVSYFDIDNKIVTMSNQEALVFLANFGSKLESSLIKKQSLYNDIDNADWSNISTYQW